MIKQDLNPPTQGAPQTFLRDCAAWTINVTDAVWHAQGDVTASIEKYFYRDWVQYSDQGVVRGIDELKAMIRSKRAAFPDLHIHIQDVMCYGNDIDGYKLVQPDVITGTNLGSTEFGPATGRRVAYRGMGTVYIQRVNNEWQTVGESVLHDTAAMAMQMGYKPQLSPPPLLHDCKQNVPTWGWKPLPRVQGRVKAKLA